MTDEMETFTIYLTPDEAEEMSAIAQRKGMTVEELIHDAVEELRLLEDVDPGAFHQMLDAFPAHLKIQ